MNIITWKENKEKLKHYSYENTHYELLKHGDKIKLFTLTGLTSLQNNQNLFNWLVREPKHDIIYVISFKIVHQWIRMRIKICDCFLSLIYV